MHSDTGNFHVFFPKGCYRKKLTPRRKTIFTALDNIIQRESFDMVLFEKTKQAYLDSMGLRQEQETFLRLNELVTPLFLLMIEQGFSKKDLQNKEGLI